MTTRKKTGLIKNKGDLTFLKKWGFSTKFFKKYFLRSKSLYDGKLSDPNKNFFFLFELLLCKLKKFYINILSL